MDPIDYEHDEPFRSFAAARDAGDFRVFAVGVALFPLELWAELLTIAVIEAPVFAQRRCGRPQRRCSRPGHGAGRRRRC
ncbi:MAG: hypothetical protein ACRDSP_14385 [Pseudonocardiaceae bacterium]